MILSEDDILEIWRRVTDEGNAEEAFSDDVRLLLDERKEVQNLMMTLVNRASTHMFTRETLAKMNRFLEIEEL